jgi:hypothetical protein
MRRGRAAADSDGEEDEEEDEEEEEEGDLDDLDDLDDDGASMHSGSAIKATPRHAARSFKPGGGGGGGGRSPRSNLDSSPTAAAARLARFNSLGAGVGGGQAQGGGPPVHRTRATTGSLRPKHLDEDEVALSGVCVGVGLGGGGNIGWMRGRQCGGAECLNGACIYFLPPNPHSPWLLIPPASVPASPWLQMMRAC